MFEASKTVDGAGINCRLLLVPSKRIKAAHRRYRKDGGGLSLTGFARVVQGAEIENAARLWLTAKGR